MELLQATKDESAIAKFIAKKGEGIHHIAFAVKDIHKEIKRLKEDGIPSLMKAQKKALTINWSVLCILKTPKVY